MSGGEDCRVVPGGGRAVCHREANGGGLEVADESHQTILLVAPKVAVADVRDKIVANNC